MTLSTLSRTTSTGSPTGGAWARATSSSCPRPRSGGWSPSTPQRSTQTCRQMTRTPTPTTPWADSSGGSMTGSVKCLKVGDTCQASMYKVYNFVDPAIIRFHPRSILYTCLVIGSQGKNKLWFEEKMYDFYLILWLMSTLERSSKKRFF